MASPKEDVKYPFQQAQTETKINLMEWRNNMTVGTYVDVIDNIIKKLCFAKVLQITSDRVYVQHLFWPNRFDEWLPRDSKRISP